jgi:hypothetical protein
MSPLRGSTLEVQGWCSQSRQHAPESINIACRFVAAEGETVQSDWDRPARRVAGLAHKLGLPGLTEGTSHGTPALKVRDKSFTRLKDSETLVLLVPLEQKELLMEVAPEIYFETDHYKGWPAVLVRLTAISDIELSQRLEDGWRFKAPKRLVASYQERKR